MDEKTKTVLSSTEERLKQNVVTYYQNKKNIDELEKEQEELKKQNLTFVKIIGLKKGEYAVFDDVRLQIQYLEMVKKTGVNEDGLILKYGKEKTDYLKVIPFKAVEMAIKIGKLPEDAEEFILKDDPIEFTKISKA
jgi:septal ring factor EnvC (AmiA/AmiB activator)